MTIMEIPKLVLPAKMDKDAVFNSVRQRVDALGLEVASIDNQRPWGGFFVISPNSQDKFLSLFFPDLKKKGGPLSLKVLLVQPEAQTSNQFHKRRKEAWHVWSGPVWIHLTDPKSNILTRFMLQNNSRQNIKRGEHHRIEAYPTHWGVLAETWIHTHKIPSDEGDIIRIDDVYGRAGK